MPVEMTKVESSHVWEVGHDPEANVLYVRYQPTVKHPVGRLVQYQGVDADTAQQVLTAPSVGGAIHALIKAGGFEFK
jgi:hypothetical protein